MIFPTCYCLNFKMRQEDKARKWVLLMQMSINQRKVVLLCFVPHYTIYSTCHWSVHYLSFYLDLFHFNRWRKTKMNAYLADKRLPGRYTIGSIFSDWVGCLIDYNWVRRFITYNIWNCSCHISSSQSASPLRCETLLVCNFLWNNHGNWDISNAKNKDILISVFLM